MDQLYLLDSLNFGALCRQCLLLQIVELAAEGEQIQCLVRVLQTLSILFYEHA